MSSQQNQPYVQPGEPLNEFLKSFWQRQINAAELETPDYRHPPLPLARIKKVMKSDPDVKMIAADAPILFCKACEIFISEITARAFIIADSNKRRTLSRSDISKALSKSDQFDFLIDIVPRDELPFPGASAAGGGSSAGGGMGGVSVGGGVSTIAGNGGGMGKKGGAGSKRDPKVASEIQPHPGGGIVGVEPGSGPTGQPVPISPDSTEPSQVGPVGVSVPVAPHV
ncbi:histone-fold-containing protein [Pluteus cervinus]|uniref:Histone-fold-containing protein n=1 Tax=Pluteus cervinus TaxID=181527 RepID=A0ACD3A2N0_9AGAR|nr:histone-fold-containing protein [Pluteus cervinus]